MSEELVGAKIKRLREARGWTPYRLASEVGTSDTYIAKLERGIIRSPGAAMLMKLAETLGVTVNDLVSPEAPNSLARSPTEADRLLELKRALDKFGLDDLKFIGEVLQVPVRGSVHAGNPCVTEQEEGEALIISRPVVEKIANTSVVYALRISGESLSGDGIHTGDQILVLPTPTLDINGKLYVIRDPNTGESVVRHLYQTADGKIRIESSNPEYKPLVLRQVEIMGRVIYIQPAGKAV
jgi:repressor LexA